MDNLTHLQEGTAKLLQKQQKAIKVSGMNKQTAGGAEFSSEVKLGRASPVWWKLGLKILDEFQNNVPQLQPDKHLESSSSDQQIIWIRDWKSVLDGRDLRALRGHCIKTRFWFWTHKQIHSSLWVQQINVPVHLSKCRLQGFHSSTKTLLTASLFTQSSAGSFWAISVIEISVFYWQCCCCCCCCLMNQLKVLRVLTPEPKCW